MLIFVALGCSMNFQIRVTGSKSITRVNDCNPTFKIYLILLRTKLLALHYNIFSLIWSDPLVKMCETRPIQL